MQYEWLRPRVPLLAVIFGVGANWMRSLPRLHHKFDQATSERRSIQSPTAKTAIPDAKMYVGGDCSAQDERVGGGAVSSEFGLGREGGFQTLPYATQP